MSLFAPEAEDNDEPVRQTAQQLAHHFLKLWVVGLVAYAGMYLFKLRTGLDLWRKSYERERYRTDPVEWADMPSTFVSDLPMIVTGAVVWALVLGLVFSIYYRESRDARRRAA